MCQSCDNRSRVLKTGFAQLVGWAAQLIQLRHDDSRTLSLCTNSETSTQADPQLAHWPSCQNFVFRRESSWWRRGGGRDCRRMSPSTSSSTTPCCWSWRARMSCWTIPCEVGYNAHFFSTLHFGSVIVGLLYLSYLPLLLVFSVSNPMIFQSLRRSSNMEAVPRLPMVEFELKSRWVSFAL